jgi:hypothetical protein
VSAEGNISTRFGVLSRELEEETRGGDLVKEVGSTPSSSLYIKKVPTVDLEYNVFIFFVNYTDAPEQHELT